MSNETTSTMIDNIVGFSYSKMYEIIASLVFLLLISQGRKTWINALHAFSFMEGMSMILMPGQYSQAILDTDSAVENSHLVLFRVTGLLVVFWAVGYFLICKSSDPTLHTSFLLAFLIQGACSMMALGYLLTHPAKKGPQISTEQVSLMFYMTLLSCTGTLFHTFNNKDWAGYGEVTSHQNFHLRINFVVLLVIGIMMYSMPQWSLKIMLYMDRVDTVHALFSRFGGAVLISMAIMSCRSANFLRTQEKEAVLATQLMYFIVHSLFMWSVVVQLDNGSWLRYSFKALKDAVIVANMFGALNRDVTVFKRVVLPKFKAIPGDIRACIKLKRC